MRTLSTTVRSRAPRGAATASVFRAVICITLVAATLLASGNASAIPLFGRKYNTTCFTCHTTPPLLNDFGRRFQANGYQLPGTAETYAQADQQGFPLGLVAQPLILGQRTRDNLLATTAANTFSFSGIEVALFSSASLGAHFSYFTAIPVAVFNGSAAVDVETASLMYNDVLGDASGALNLRMGKFRFLLPFQAITLLANPNVDPLVYAYSAFDGKSNLIQANDFTLSEPTFGASAYGMLPQIAEGLRWELGLTGGNASDIDLNTAKAFFVALDQTFYLNNAPVRLGGFYSNGAQDITNTSDTIAGELLHYTNHPMRAGVSLEVYDPWSKRFDLFGEYSVAKDDNVDTVGSSYSMTGGFVGLNVIVVPERLYLYGRYDFLTAKETSDERRQIDLGVQYHVLPNVFLTGIYTVTTDKIPQSLDQTTTSFGAGVRFGF